MPGLLIPTSHAMKGLFCMTPGATEAAAAPFGFSFVDLTAGSADLAAVDPRFSFLTELPDTKVLLFRDSCNGLVLLEHREERLADRLGYIVCNPTTKEWAAVPACGSPTLQTYPYLAFDPAVSLHFNLVQFQVEDYEQEFLSVHAYSSETRTWSDNLIDEQGEEEGQFPGWRQVSFYLGGKSQPCPFVNGFLHLVVWEQGEMKVVAVDVQGKGRRMIPVPQQPDSALWMCYFGESQGRLHYMTQEMLGAREDRFKLSVWALEAYDAQEWVLKGVVNTGEVFGENGGGGRNMEFEVVDIHQDRNVVFLTHPLEHDLVAYDMDREEVRTVATFDEHEELIGTARYVQCY
ncbi:unnamed protein product [Urochloa decumbens]|uniref:F-box protein At3g26010-like beta-propeller domain-containing protein n=1 Tax=Urochloa decumbens TaxID=240449 RepID=A0ABC9G951_9POAL